jgi:hypothetical protein
MTVYGNLPVLPVLPALLALLALPALPALPVLPALPALLALLALLDDVGATFKPKVVCVLHPGNAGAGIVDAGLFEKSQLRKGEMRGGQVPLRGVVEIKGVAESVSHTIGTEQITRYVAHYGQVLVTNYRQFALLGRDLTVEEARYVSEMIRRIAAILALGPALDENYERVKRDVFEWK